MVRSHKPGPGYTPQVNDRYNHVSPQFWSDEKVAQWDDDTRLLALYLLTCRHRFTEGLYHLPKAYAMGDLKWSAERFAIPFAKLLSEGFADYDEQTSVVLLRQCMKYQVPANENVITAAMKRLDSLPNSVLLQEFIALAERFAIPFAKRLRERYGERLPIPFAERYGKPLSLSLALSLTPTLMSEGEPEDSLLRFALDEIPPSESTPDDYLRTINRYRPRMPEHQIERIVAQLANWKPDKPRAKMHLTLASWLSKEKPEPLPTNGGGRVTSPPPPPDAEREADKRACRPWDYIEDYDDKVVALTEEMRLAEMDPEGEDKVALLNRKFWNLTHGVDDATDR